MNNQIIIIVAYEDNLNLVGIPKELTITFNYLKIEFEIKDIIKQNFVLTC